MVTSLEYIKKIAEGSEIEIIGWEDDVKFVCKLKRVSMLNLVSSGAIPNFKSLTGKDYNYLDKITLNGGIKNVCKEI